MSAPDRPFHQSPLALLVLTGLLQGIMLPMSRVATNLGWSPLSFAFWPALGSGLVLLALGLRTHGQDFDRKRLIRFSFINGLVGIAIPNCLAFMAIQHIGAAPVALMFTLPPLFTISIAWLIGMERYHPWRLAGILVGLCGAVLLVLGRSSLDHGISGWLLLALCVPLSLGVGNIYRKLYMPVEINSTLLAGGMLLGAAVLMLPLVFTGEIQLLPWPQWRVILVQCLFTTIGYIVYFRFQKVADAVYFSQLGYVLASVGVFSGLLFFGERLAPSTILAIALIVAGIAMLNRHMVPAAKTGKS